MTHTPKRPPPDSVGNIRGRMAQLRATAHGIAMGGIHIIHVDEKNKGTSHSKREAPEDYDKRLAQALKDLAPEFKKLERRLKKCPKVEPITREQRDARKAAKAKPKKKKTPPADTRERAKAKMNGRKHNTASAILDGGDTQAPLSREDALTEGVAQDHKPGSDLLNFMQSTLDQ